jgi:cytochrome d ubiquinol oxidase subunit II
MVLQDVAAPQVTLRFVLYALPIGLAMLIPSLWLLFRVFKWNNP